MASKIVRLYIVLITCITSNASNNKTWIATFPDLPGCMTQGESIEDVYLKSKEALALYYKAKNGDISAPTVQLIEAQQEYPNSIIHFVELDTSLCIKKDTALIKKNLTLPKWLNTLANNYNLNFSLILKNALIQHLLNLDNLSSYDRKMLEE